MSESGSALVSEERTPQPDGSLGTGIFVSVIIALILSIVPFVAVLLIPPVLVYVFFMRRRATSLWRQQGRLTQERDQVTADARKLWDENHFLRQEAQRLGVMDDLSRGEHRNALEKEIARVETELKARRDEGERKVAQVEAELRSGREAGEAQQQNYAELVRKEQARLEQVREDIVDLRDMADLNDYGLYNFENPADDSVRYKDELQTRQAEIREMVRQKTAATGSTSMTLDGNLKKGQKMVGDMTKLLLRAFNAEAENSVKTVKAGHLNAAIKRLEKSAQQVERLGKSMAITISSRYLFLREEELRLTHAHLEAVKAAKEEEKEARARVREEAKAQKEFLALKAKQEKEVEHRRIVLAQLQAQGDVEEASKAAAALSHAEAELEDVESTMANTRAGYVYVASNRGAFGSEVVKIGMTRRLNPEERLKELSDASVPFNFDKHTVIFSEDAWGLESALHRHFADRRVNLINMRREYFYATPSEVKDALLQHDVQVLEYHEEAEAPEFLASQKMREERTAECAVQA